MDKPFRTVACVGELAAFNEWLTALLGDEDRVTDLCAELKGSGSAWTFIGTKRGPLELALCDERRTLISLVQADATVAVSPQSMSFAFISAALGAPLCLPADDEPLPVDAIWDTEVAPLDVDGPLVMRVEKVEKADGLTIPRGTVLAGRVAVGDDVSLPGLGTWAVAGVLSDELAQDEGHAGEVLGLLLRDFEAPPELLGSLFCTAESTESVGLDIADGGARLWWPTGWARVTVKGGVATLRAPRVLPVGTTVVVAREGRWSLANVREVAESGPVCSPDLP